MVEMGLRTDYCGSLRLGDAGRHVALCGWVARRREHGEHLAFVDLRDHTGIVQCVVDGAHDLRNEYVLRVIGTVRIRPEGPSTPSSRPARSRSPTATSKCWPRPNRPRSHSTSGSRRPTRSCGCGTAMSTCGATGCSATCG